MSRFKVSLIVLGVVVISIVTIGACAGQASARSRSHPTTARLVSRAGASASSRVAALPVAVVDTEWAVASHVNW